jgi:hypothetical protein
MEPLYHSPDLLHIAVAGRLAWADSLPDPVDPDAQTPGLE